MKTSDRITEQDFQELRDAGYFPYSSGAIGGGSLLATALVTFFGVRNATYLKVILISGSTATIFKFAFNLIIVISLIYGFFIVILGLFQTKFFIGSPTKFKNKTGSSPVLWLVITGIASLLGFFYVLNNVPAILSALMDRPSGEVIPEIFMKFVKNISILAILVIFGGIILARVYFNIIAKRLLNSVHTKDGG